MCTLAKLKLLKKKGSFGFSLYKCIDAIGAEVIEKIINNTLRTNSID